MKSSKVISSTRRYFLHMAGMGITAVFACSALSARSAVGSVSDLKGEAYAELENQRRTLSVKSSVFLSDSLNTGSESKLVAKLARRTILRLGAKTKIKIDKFIVDAGGEIILDTGAILLDSPKSQKRRLKVRSPFALIAVRGTRFFAGTLGSAFSVFVVKGVVDVSAGGKTIRLQDGEGTDIARPGDEPGPVKKWGTPKIAKAMALVN